MPAMSVPQPIARSLGQELQGLHGDDGARLSQILWRLEAEVRRAPYDLEVSVAYNHALAYAGRAQEARREAQRALGLVQAMRDTPVLVVLNVAGALLDAGLADETEALLEEVYVRADLGPGDAGLLRHNALGLAVRFGRVQWFEARFGVEVALDFIRARGFGAWWSGQQQAIEAAIGGRVATTNFGVVDFFDGTARLAMHYHTDALSHSEVDALNTAVLEAVTQAYAEHPDGPGAFLGHIVITVHGPKIPLEELEP